jgi:methyl-accepting chemotaxis protein
MFFIASLVILYASRLISSSIATPIVMLKDTVEEFARGNYTARAEYESEDEFGDLGKAFNRMAVQITEAQTAVEAEKLKVEEKQKKEEEQKKYLERNINHLLEEMGKFENGDLTASVKPERDDDEIGRLFYGFNKAVSKIKEIIIKVTDAVQATASASSEISASAEELAAGAQQQSSQASEIAGAVEEMTSTIFENTKNTTAAAETAKSAEDIANQGAELGNETVSGMLEISEVVSTAALRVKDLGQKTDQIGEIIQVIDEIADQTNLLALNAAIEAARAGEEGRGFAVVADEVRKLAERTVSATKEIAEKIKEIQDDTNGVVLSIQDGTNVAEIGKVSAQKVGDSLNEITNSFRRVLDTVTQVAAASEEQSATSEEIAKNIEAISNVTQQTASGTEQIARASEDLNRLTDNLQLIVESFKVDDSDNSYKSKSNLKDYTSLIDDNAGNTDNLPVEGVYRNGYH